MTRALLDALLDAAEEQARTVLIGRHQPLAPSWVLVNALGERQVLATPWGDEAEKYLARILVQLELKIFEAVAYSFLTEAWLATQPPDWQPEQGWQLRPAQRPDRKECVIALATNGEETRWRCWHLIRDHHEQVIKLEPYALDSEQEPESWMADLLKKE